MKPFNIQLFKTLGIIFIFLALLIWQQVEAKKRAYKLRDDMFELRELENINNSLNFRVRELLSSENLMKYAAANNFEFPNAARIIYINPVIPPWRDGCRGNPCGCPLLRAGARPAPTLCSFLTGLTYAQ